VIWPDKPWQLVSYYSPMSWKRAATDQNRRSSFSSGWPIALHNAKACELVLAEMLTWPSCVAAAGYLSAAPAVTQAAHRRLQGRLVYMLRQHVGDHVLEHWHLDGLILVDAHSRWTSAARIVARR
jgi:hypothetical protein